MLRGWAAATLVSLLGTGHSCLSLWAVQEYKHLELFCSPSSFTPAVGIKGTVSTLPLAPSPSPESTPLSHLPSDALAAW